ncbi:MAG: IS66 family insertion sequence element accessory protein TnpB [Gammaproteobacteria bacterium]|nr:IS66 family insertion sequence element accessory protein TnpB [Gammaproteobacteria bacterium]
MFVDVSDIYLYRDPVDFRKAINGLVLIVEQQMQLSPFSEALFVFCNKSRDKANGLIPFDYLKYLLEELPGNPEDINYLLPWNVVLAEK